MCRHLPTPIDDATLSSTLLTREMDKAISIIEDEHRSLAAVLHMARKLMDESHQEGVLPDFSLLDLALFYIRRFPEELHHPKEDLYLFDCLRKRTREVDDTLAILQQHHGDRSLLDELSLALVAYKCGQDGARRRFALALNAFSEAEFRHMTLEEHDILPAARTHLAKEDWVRMTSAFGENNTPGPDNVADGLFKSIFSRLMQNASPADRIAPTLAG